MIFYVHKRRLKQALRGIQKDNEALFDSNPTPMWIYDLETLRFLKVNNAATHIYGYSKEEFLSMTLKDIRPTEEVLKLESKLSVPLNDFESGNIWNHQKKNGDILTVQLTTHTIVFDHKNCRLVQTHDITEICRAKEEKEAAQKIALESLSRFETLSRASNEALWEWNCAANTVKWNYGVTSLFGYEELTYDFDWFIRNVHPEDFIRMNRNFEQAFREKKNLWTEEYRFKTADGEYRDVFTRTIINYNDAGEPVSLMGATKDITEKRKYEREITKLSFVARYTNNGVIITDKEGAIEWVNDAFKDLTGYTLDEVKGKKPSSFLEAEETRESFNQEIRNLIKSGKIIHREVLNYRKDGSRFWARINISPVLKNNEICNFVTVQTDITEIMLQEEKIKKQNHLLRNIAFEAAHHTRRPLANIMGLIALLNIKDVSHPSYDKELDLLKDSAHELDQVIGSIIKKTGKVERECYL